MRNVNIGELRFFCTDLQKKVTIQEFFKIMLFKLWQNPDMFNGKRPFGNSGWEMDLEIALLDNYVIKGIKNKDGYWDKWDREEANKIISDYLNPNKD